MTDGSEGGNVDADSEVTGKDGTVSGTTEGSAGGEVEMDSGQEYPPGHSGQTTPWPGQELDCTGEVVADGSPVGGAPGSEMGAYGVGT